MKICLGSVWIITVIRQYKFLILFPYSFSPHTSPYISTAQRFVWGGRGCFSFAVSPPAPRWIVKIPAKSMSQFSLSAQCKGPCGTPHNSLHLQSMAAWSILRSAECQSIAGDTVARWPRSIWPSLHRPTTARMSEPWQRLKLPSLGKPAPEGLSLWAVVVVCQAAAVSSCVSSPFELWKTELWQ